jgi:hypothetical protein
MMDRSGEGGDRVTRYFRDLLSLRPAVGAGQTRHGDLEAVDNPAGTVLADQPMTQVPGQSATKWRPPVE